LAQRRSRGSNFATRDRGRGSMLCRTTVPSAGHARHHRYRYFF
jgi:hypothetical protein